MPHTSNFILVKSSIKIRALFPRRWRNRVIQLLNLVHRQDPIVEDILVWVKFIRRGRVVLQNVSLSDS